MDKTFWEKKKLSLGLLLQRKLKNLLNVSLQLKPQEQTQFHRNLSPPLTAAITKSKEENISSESPKIASVVPRTTGKPNKNEFSNFRPVSVLNAFSKFYEKFIKKQFQLDFMEQYFFTCDICIQDKLKFTIFYYLINRKMKNKGR